MKSRAEESLRTDRKSRVDSYFPWNRKLSKGSQDLQLLVELGGWQRDRAS